MTTSLIPVFDVGNVFIDWNPMHLFRKLFDSEEEAQWFHDNICTLGWNLEFDRGRPFEVGVNRLIARHPKFWREIEAYDTRWIEMVREVHADSVAVHDELIALGHKTYAITNFSAEKWRLALPKWSFFQKFDGTVVSGIEGLVKPDAAIFELFLERYDLRAPQCVFIDDSRANVTMARSLGFETVHLTDPARLRDELIELGFDLKRTG